MPIQIYSFEKYVSNKISAKPEVIKNLYQALEQGFSPAYIVDYKKEISQDLKYFEVCLINQKRKEWKLLSSKKEKLINDLKRSNTLSKDLEQKIYDCPNLDSFRIIYKDFNKSTLPKAHHAKKAGLDKFAKWMLDQAKVEKDLDQTLEQEAKKFINTEASLVSVRDILSATQQILVEDILNNKEFNKWIYQSVEQSSISIEAGKKEIPAKHKAWIAYTKPCSLFFKPSMYAKYLEIRKLWRVGFLKVNIDLDQAKLQEKIYAKISPFDNVKLRGFLYNTVQLALNQRLIPRYTQEKHREFEEKALKSETYKFLKSLDSVLMQAPIAKNQNVLGVWPLKDSCYVAIVNSCGEYIASTFLSFEKENKEASKKLLHNILKDISVQYISLPTQPLSFSTKNNLKDFLDQKKELKFIWTQNLAVNLYSKDLAKKDFPDLHFDQSKAVFLARQLQSSFTEFLRLDLHNLSLTDTQHLLAKETVEDKISSTVNRAIYSYGLNLNVCSASALMHLKSFTPELAEAVLKFRLEKSGFTEINELKNVPNLSPEVFEAVAGSFVLLSSKNYLDKTRIHPKQYSMVKEMAKELACSTKSLLGSGAEALKDISGKWKKLLGEYSYNFLYNELKNYEEKTCDNIDKVKPYIESINLSINKIEDIKEALSLDVWVKRLSSFGVFADFGLDQQGLILLSTLKKEKQSLYPGMWLKVKIESANIENKKFIFKPEHIYSDFKKIKIDFKKTFKAKSFTERKKNTLHNTKSSFKLSKPEQEFKKSKVFVKPKKAFNNPFAELQSMSSLLKEKK